MIMYVNYNTKFLTCKTKSMTADFVIDFESHLKRGDVYKVELQLPYELADGSGGYFDYDVYLVAQNANQAHYLANCMYPDAVSVAWSDDPITSGEYDSRRNTSKV